MGCVYQSGGSIMLTTGNSNIDNLFKKSKTISSKHKVLAEWNHNAYTIVDYIGSYPLEIIGDGVEADQTQALTFNTSELTGCWDNGGHYYTVSSTPNDYEVEEPERKKINPIKLITEPERPDPGIIFPVTFPAARDRNLFADASEARAYNILQTSNRVYAANESQSGRYWVSARRCKSNATYEIDSNFIGVSNSLGKMRGNNVFVHYKEAVRCNKIVVKTQTVNGYARDFTVEVLLSGSNNWTSIYRTTNSTTMSDGILRLSRKYISGSWQWVVAAGVEEEGALTSFLKSSTTGYQSIKGIRFSVQELADVNTNDPKEDGTLDVIELSPRMVVDLSAYTEEFSSSSNIGDSFLGLPIGSMVAGDGQVRLFSEENLISDKNVLSIFYGMLKPNVKFTFLHEVTDQSVTKYIPINVMYTNAWEEAEDWSVTASLSDYMKFLKDKPAPDILLGALDGIRVSAIIKILLDNAGFTRFSFNKTAETKEYEYEDIRIDFFWCRKEMSVAEAIDQLAKTAQISVYFDQFGILNAATKESVLQKTESWNYALVGDYNELDSGDPEYSSINGVYVSNIEAFEDSVLAPINAGEVAYSSLGIPKGSFELLENSLTPENAGSAISLDTSKIIDAGYSEVTLNRNISYIPQQVWNPNNDQQNAAESLLSCGVLIKDLQASRPKTILDGLTFSAKNKNDAIRKAFAGMTLVEKSSCQIVIAENDMAVSYRNRFSGYVYIDTELIKFYGILYNVTKPGYVNEIKIYFSQAEVDSDIAAAPSGASFVPYSLIVEMDMAVSSYPDSFLETPAGYVYFCKNDGRGFKDTEVSLHYCGLLESNGWGKFASKVYASPTGQISDYGQSMKVMVDTGVPDSVNIATNSVAYGGYANLAGPPSSKTGTASIDFESIQIDIKDSGQQVISGFVKDTGINPTRVGTRMNLFSPGVTAEQRKAMSDIAGICFYLSGGPASTGYFLEVQSPSGSYTPGDVYLENVKFYKVYNDAGTMKPKLLGSAGYKDAAPTTFERTISVTDVGKSQEALKSVFSLEVQILDSKKDFVIFINGQQAMTAHDDSPLSPTNNVGVFVRDDSNAIYDYVYAISTPNGAYPSISSLTDNNESFYGTNIEISKSRGIFSPFLKDILGSSIPIYYDDFGNTVREVKYIQARFNEPAFSTKLIELSRVNPDYFIKEFKSSSWGASFWVYNSSRSSVWLGNGTNFPLFISGMILKKMGGGTVDIKESMPDSNESSSQDQIEINKRLYGEQSLNISAEYLNSYKQAYDLAEWIARYSSFEKKEIRARIFPNPLLQLGDKIKVVYKSRGFSYNDIGDKTYVLSEIDYSVGSNGIQMDVLLREML
jgi:hypothetical protein